jgi:NAD(P)-dependent dehydrogenase (short-subunit alcohol dehydrogenase family)
VNSKNPFLNQTINGKTVLITGSTSGIGLELTKALLNNGATVIMGSKSSDLTKTARQLSQHQRAYLYQIDLADLDQIKEVVESISKDVQCIDILINNAGIMEPEYCLTKQGFESQFGINYMGHFALTYYILKQFPELNRIVNVSSLTALNSTLDYKSFKDHELYIKSKSYGQSKLANLIFSLELNKRLINSGSQTRSVAAHPGYSRTQLQRHVKGLLRKTHVLLNKYLKGQSAKNGALPILFAATDPEATGSEYYVPGGNLQLTGNPIKIEYPDLQIDPEGISRLWEYSENQTGITYCV